MVAKRNQQSVSIVQAQAERREEYEKERARRQREDNLLAEQEKRLEALSFFTYQPINYEAALTKQTYSEPEIPDFSYLLTQAEQKVTQQYKKTFILQGGIAAAFGLLSLIFLKSVFIIVGVAGMAACAISINRDLKSKQISLEKAIAAAESLIVQKEEAARESIEQERTVFVQSEQERVEKLQRFLEGDISLEVERIETVLQETGVPFSIITAVYYQKQCPVVIVSLPDLKIIPKFTNAIVEGSTVREEKPKAEINRQYTEVLAATVFRIAVLLYENLPNLDNLCIQGVEKVDEEEKNDELAELKCLISLKTNRQTVLDAVACSNGREALTFLGATHYAEEAGLFEPVEPVFPEWWNQIPHALIQKVTVAYEYGEVTSKPIEAVAGESEESSPEELV
ncbi:MAG: hypothetical protein H6Q75_76 [Firmicutes bacterium]|nr:hypothetical protein [Bacillota bacterium]